MNLMMCVRRRGLAAVLVAAVAVWGCKTCDCEDEGDKKMEMGKKAAEVKAAVPTVGQWAPLFNGKNLDGFYTFLEKEGKNQDAKGIFKVEDGMLHIMGVPASAEVQETGYVCTEKSYGNYVLRFEYKWGEKKFAPRATLPRDSGCHYLLTGEDKVWASAVEFQVQEGETGDVYVLNNGYRVQTTVKSLTDQMKVYAEGGAVWPMTGSRLIRSETRDTAAGWNQCELIVDGNSSTHIVNGKPVAHLQNIVRRSDGTAVTEGRIGFQSEAAEMYYRNIEIKLMK